MAQKATAARAGRQMAQQGGDTAGGMEMSLGHGAVMHVSE